MASISYASRGQQGEVLWYAEQGLGRTLCIILTSFIDSDQIMTANSRKLSESAEKLLNALHS